MNVNWGLFPPLEAELPKRSEDGRRLNPTERGRAKKRAMALRALTDLAGWLEAVEGAPPSRERVPA
jgi:methylenetetrahydrofolate--tRNA-(uracil-5-)-methyltransferase